MAINEYTAHFSCVLKYLIADYTRKQGLTLNEIADAIGISRAALSKYQNNEAEPGIAAVAKIAQYFDVQCDYLLGTTLLSREEAIQEVNRIEIKRNLSGYFNNAGQMQIEDASMDDLKTLYRIIAKKEWDAGVVK